MPSAVVADPRLSPLFQGLTDRYRFDVLLGQGGAGTVFGVTNLALQRREALKVLTEYRSPESVARFTHEARTAAGLDHPGIVRIYEFGEMAGYSWYAMQRVDGPSLAHLIHRRRVFEPEDILRLALPLVEALQHSHSQGVIHRDIKPANILLDLQGHPRLADFGIAKSTDSSYETRTGMLVGTPAFVAPEQAKGLAVDARADQYALATTLYLMASGRLPHESEQPMAALMRRIQEDAEDLNELCPSLPREFSATIMRALARDPGLRFDDMSAFGTKLQASLPGVDLSQSFPFDQESLPAPTPLSWQVTERAFAPTADLPGRKKRKTHWVMGGALLLSLVCIPVWMWWRQNPGPSLPQSPAPKAPVETPPLTKPEVPAAKARSPLPSPKLPSPVQNPQVQGRPVQYPQLLSSPPYGTFPSLCQGLQVRLSLQIGSDGQVASVRILNELDPACTESVKAYAMSLVYRPALDAQGHPVPATVAIALQLPEAP